MNPTIKNRHTDIVLFEGEEGMTTRAMLEKATTSRVDLRGADLRSTDLRGANLRGADLQEAHLRGSDLRSADLAGVNLRGSDLRGADLAGVNLRGSDIRGTNLRGADLYCADLGEANLGEKFGKLIKDRPYFQCGPIGSRSDYLQSFITDKGVVIKAGCYMGFLDEFTAAVEKTHGDSDNGKEYAMVILMIEAHAAIWSKQ